MKLSLYIFFLLSLSSLKLIAQGNNSPYSIIGIGDIDDNYYNRTSGLGNTGIAYRSSRFLINNNPASYSALDNQIFTAELGIRGSFIDYSGTPVNVSNNQSADITFRKFVMGIKGSKHWGTSFGLVPFSTENYEFNNPFILQGTTSEVANSYYQGYGSINKVYWANSYDFFHHVSLGIDLSYLFGTISQKEIIQNAGLVTLLSTTNNINLTNLVADYGIQAYGKLGRRWDYSLGATFANRSDLFARYTTVVLGPDSAQLYSKTLQQTYFTLPTSYGFGFSLTKDKKYTFVGDYKYQGWSNLGYAGNNYQLENSQKVSAGFELSKSKTYYNAKIEKAYFQSGIYYGNSYLSVNGKQIRDRGLTVGYGLNSLKSPLSYSIVLQYGIKGTIANDLIEEKYVNLTFALSFREAWYTKGKKWD